MNRYLSKEESTALKGVAILWMIFHHCYHETGLFDYLNLNFYPFDMESVLNVGIYAKVCVAIFAFVSGYGLYISYMNSAVIEGDSKWIWNRLKKVMTTFCTVAVISYVYFAIKALITGEEFFSKYGNSLSEIVISIAADIFGVSKLLDTRSLNGAWWYISAAIIFMIVAPAFYKLLNQFGSVFVIGVLIVLPRILKLEYFGQTSIYVYLEVFVVGMIACHADWFGKFYRKFYKNSLAKAATAVVLIALFVLSIHNNLLLSRKVFWEYHYIVVPLINIFLCIFVIFKIPGLKKVFAYLGKYSTVMWLVHIFYRNAMNAHVPDNTWFMITPIVLVVVSLVSAIIYDKVRSFLK
ncbi:MAG: acyltransferase [Lachnospiraceae bacterium]|nr:acyltransferase [Lachnospiraceae bacterium]